MRSFDLASENRHLVWDNALDAAISVAPGDEIVLDLVDASGGQIGPSDDASAIDRLDFAAVNPCTGPVFVEGVPAGSEVIVSILEIDTDGWAWTANIPGFGLLSDDFPQRHLWTSKVSNGTLSTPVGVEMPARPMIGTIGVAPSAPGPAPLLVPTDAGGNMDIAQLSAGAELHLPVQVAGALLSAGDADCLQGDGEVCGTGAETSATVRLRVDVNARRVAGSVVRALGAAPRELLDRDDGDRSRSFPGSAAKPPVGRWRWSPEAQAWIR